VPPGMPEPSIAMPLTQPVVGLTDVIWLFPETVVAVPVAIW
jgi:hypothetical protein